ncbi:MAG: 2-dehydropantoate 2-reductase [Planctomycetota bacterium]|jgi:2-dehydropantoate 2-reductase
MSENSWKLSSGSLVKYRSWLPDKPEDSPALLLMHGVESHSEWFSELGPLLAAKGIAAYAPDRPGWGVSEGTRGHLASYEDAMDFIDICSAEILKNHSDIHLAGLSWGGKFSLYAALRRPGLFKSLTLIAPGLAAAKSVSLTDKLKIAGDIIAGSGEKLIALPINPDHFTARKDKTDYIINDPSRIKHVTTAFCLESLKMDKFIEENINRLKIPAQLLLAENDKIIDNTATDRLFTLAGSKSKKKHFHSGAEHSLVFETPELCADNISDWLSNHHKQVESPENIVVMGAGAVGSTVGGLLAQAGHNVTLIARQSHTEKINHEGLRLNIGKSSQLIKNNLTALTSPDQYQLKADLIIVCVKSYDTEVALAQVDTITEDSTSILCLQNGVMNEGKIAEHFPDNPLVAGAICGYLSFDNPGEITLSSDKGGISVGPWRENDVDAAVKCQALLQDSGMQIDFQLDGKRIKWSKLMLNVAFNAINALTGLGTSKIMADEKLGPLAVKTFAECAAVMQKAGVTPVDLPGYGVSKLAKVMKLPACVARKLIAFSTRNEAQGTSSMAQDFSKGKGRSEIEEINGAVTGFAEKYSLSTPANTHLLNVVKAACKDCSLYSKFTKNPQSIADFRK